jgi:hypothetical protein
MVKTDKMKKQKIEEIEINDECYVKIPTLALFEKWAKEGDWKNGDDFFAETGINPIDLLDVWFIVIHGRVYIMETDK